MNTKYCPSNDFIRVKENEDHRLFEQRLYALLTFHHLTEAECRLILLRIDIQLSLDFDKKPFNTDAYKMKADEYLEDILNQSNEKVRNLVAQIQESIVL